MTQINLYTWFANRELSHLPVHFVVVDTPITIESKQWILEKLIGRFCLLMRKRENSYVYDQFPAFEDPAEATYFQLLWA
jgi:hypothetical protein